MKLTPKTVRKILIALEEKPDGAWKDDSMGEAIPEIPPEEIIHAIHVMIQAGYVEGTTVKGADGSLFAYAVYRLTWDGHQLLENLRSDTVFNKVLDTVSQKVGSASIEIIAKLAASFTKDMLGIPV